MQRRYREVPKEERVIRVKCARAQHEIFVSERGRVRFLSHSCVSPQVLLQEGYMRNLDERGCYLFAKLLLRKVSNDWSYHAGDFVKVKARRTFELRSLHNAGIDEVAAGLFFNDAYKRRSERIKEREYIDDYPEPFHRMPLQRIERIYSCIRAEQTRKLRRVRDSLKLAGFQPRESWELPSYRR